MKHALIPFAALSFFVAGCGNTPTGNTDLAPAAFDSLMKANPEVQLVDVRTLEEYTESHIAGSLNYDWNDASFTENADNNLDKSKPVLVYCHSGNRSNAAADYLRENGFSAVYELNGGITAWKEAGLPVTEATVVDPPSTTTAGDHHDGPISLEQYKSLIAENEVVLVDFTATWCGPCKMLAPSLHELETEMSDKFILVTVDVDRDLPVAQYMNIQAMPTLVLYKKGDIQWRNEGVVAKQLIADKINSVQ